MNQAHLTQLQHLLAKIPKGRVTTYKAIAHAMDMKGYRYIGQLLNKNPDPETFPCFKVVNSDGRLGGFALGHADKIRRLQQEGIEVSDGKIVNFEKILYICK